MKDSSAHGLTLPAGFCFKKWVLRAAAMSFGAEFAYALGTVIAPYCEAMVQQRSNAAMASFVQMLRPDEVSQGTDDPRMKQQMVYEHGDQLLRDHMQATLPQQQPPPVPQGQEKKMDQEKQPKPMSPPAPAEPMDEDQAVPKQPPPKAQVDPPSWKGYARKVAKYKTEAGTLEVFLRFVPTSCDTGEPVVLEGPKQHSAAEAEASGSNMPPPPTTTPSPKTTSAPPPPPPPDSPPPVMESRPKVPSPTAPPKAPPKPRPPSRPVIEQLPKLVSVKVMLCLLPCLGNKPSQIQSDLFLVSFP